MKKLMGEFKEFIARGNVMDMAVGVIVGGAFNKIVTSLVGDVIMPAISLLTGRISFADWAVRIPSAAAEGGAIIISFGLFIQNVVDFLITALCVFLIVKLLNRMHRKKEAAAPAEPPAPPAPTREQELLAEIRDLLREERSESAAASAGR